MTKNTITKLEHKKSKYISTVDDVVVSIYNLSFYPTWITKIIDSGVARVLRGNFEPPPRTLVQYFLTFLQICLKSD